MKYIANMIMASLLPKIWSSPKKYNTNIVDPKSAKTISKLVNVISTAPRNK